MDDNQSIYERKKYALMSKEVKVETSDGQANALLSIVESFVISRNFESNTNDQNYIKFSNGIMIAFGNFSMKNHLDVIKYGVTFKWVPYTIITRIIGVKSISNASNVGLSLYADSAYCDGFALEGDPSADTSDAIWGIYFAIGRWK